MSTRFTGALVALILLLSLVTVHADENKRVQLKTEIDTLVGNIASELRDVPTDSSTSDLDYTVRYG